jgi:hypothetical protein
MAQAAAVLGAFGVPLVLVPRSRLAILAGLALIAAAEVLFASDRHVSASQAALGLVGLGLLATTAAFFVLRPVLVLPVLLLAAPFRLPLDFGPEHRLYVALARGGEAGRLLPLYFVLAAAALALAYRLVRDHEPKALPPEISVPLAALTSWACLSYLWSDATVPAENLVVYFLLPFAVLVAVAARAPFPAWMPRALGAIAVALAGLFAVVGLVEEATHRLIFYTPSVEVGNAYSSFFRVTSLFRDPSLYGRHVVLGIAVLLVALLYSRISWPLGLTATAVLFAGLFYSYSQSSLVALFAVTLFVGVFTGDRTVRLVAAGAAVLVVAAVAVYVGDKAATHSAERVTSDRSRRVEFTARVFEHHPFVGVGIGSQPRASQRLSDDGRPPTLYVSHTTPLTVAAELGAVGLAFYVALLLGAGHALARLCRLDEPFGVALSAVFLALVVHSLAYSGFFEDPLTWLALGLASSALAATRTAAQAA